MNRTYELMDTIYHHYLKESELLFLHQLDGFLSEVSMSELHEAIGERLTSTVSEDVIEPLMGQDHLVFYGETPFQSIYVSMDAPMDSKVLDLLDETVTYTTIAVKDRYYRYNKSTVIYFNETEQTILFSHRFMDEHEYVLVKNGELTSRVNQSLEHFAYLLLILSTLADLFFLFED